jgi:hypothetical protein
MKRATLAMSAAIAMSTAAAGQTPTQRLAVPAFFPLSTNGVVNNDWVRIQRAGSVAKIVVPELDTIGNGVPGTGCTSSPTAMFDCLHGNTQLVLGYVYTNSGQRDLGGNCPTKTCVLHGGDTVAPYAGIPYVDKWYSTYGGHIDGIFFDVGPSLYGTTISEADQKAYYQSLYQTLTTPGSPNFRSGPCGGHACIMVNASQFYNDWAMSVADYAVLWERALHGSDMSTCNQAGSQDYFDRTWFCPADGVNPSNCAAPAQNPAGWYFTPTNAAKAAHVIFSVHSAADISRIIAQSRSSYGSPGFLYIHDQDCDPAHGAVYSRLPPYFEQVVAALNPSSIFAAINMLLLE